MDRWFLLCSTLLAFIGGIRGMIAVHHGKRSPWTVAWMSASLIAQCGYLWLRGQSREACPLGDTGEILAFLSWSLNLFYLLVGPPYRISLLGVFTAPLVALLQAIALLPGVMTLAPTAMRGSNAWHETHSATSVLAYGALALAAVAGTMFLVLDRQLKEHLLKSSLFRNLPPVRELLISLTRLVRLGTLLLTIGIVAGFVMPHDQSALPHLIAAVLVWIAYMSLLVIQCCRGLSGKWLSLTTVLWFVLSLGVFVFI